MIATMTDGGPVALENLDHHNTIKDDNDDNDDVSTSSTERVSELASDFNEKASLRSFSSSVSDGDCNDLVSTLSPIKVISSPQSNNRSNPQSGSIGTRSTSSPPQSVVSEADAAAIQSVQVIEEGLTLARFSALEKSHSEPALSECGASFASVSTFANSPYENDCRKLFIGGLAASVTEAEFRSFFEKFGTVVDTRVMVDHVTKRNRGFGFVTFEESEVARQVVSEERRGLLRLNGKPIDVKLHIPKQLNRDNSSSIASSTVDTRPKPPRVPFSSSGNPGGGARFPYPLRGSPPSYPRAASVRNGGGSCSSLGDEAEDCASICSSTTSSYGVENDERVPSEHDYHSSYVNMTLNSSQYSSSRNNRIQRSATTPSSGRSMRASPPRHNGSNNLNHSSNRSMNHHRLNRSSSSSSMNNTRRSSHSANSSRPSSCNSDHSMYDNGNNNNAYCQPQPYYHPHDPAAAHAGVPMQMMYAYMMPIVPAPPMYYAPYVPMPMYGSPNPSMQMEQRQHEQNCVNSSVESEEASSLNESELTTGL